MLTKQCSDGMIIEQLEFPRSYLAKALVNSMTYRINTKYLQKRHNIKYYEKSLGETGKVVRRRR